MVANAGRDVKVEIRPGLVELVLPQATSIPQLVLEHRSHHGAPMVNTIDFTDDKPVWRLLSPNRQEVFVHVLTRFAYGMKSALSVVGVLRRASEKHGGDFVSNYDQVHADTRYVFSECERYRLEVAASRADPKALTPNFVRIFDDTFPNLTLNLYRAFNKSRAEQIAAEVQLRTVYHIIGEGLGAITGIWGLQKALAELKEESGDLSLPGLSKLVDSFTLVLRRHIAFGMSEMGELAAENYWLTVKTLLRQFRILKPVLERMRGETFERWPEFPFAIDQKELADRGRRRVLSWVRQFVILRPGFVRRKRLRDLSRII